MFVREHDDKEGSVMMDFQGTLN